MLSESIDSNVNGLTASMLQEEFIELIDEKFDLISDADMVPQDVTAMVYGDMHRPVSEGQISLMKTRHQAHHSILQINQDIKNILSQVEKNRLRAVATGARDIRLWIARWDDLWNLNYK